MSIWFEGCVIVSIVQLVTAMTLIYRGWVWIWDSAVSPYLKCVSLFT